MRIPILSIFLFTLLLLGACKDDPCKKVSCEHGQCEEGDCICDFGYEGVRCDTLERDKFLGVFRVTESCGSDTFLVEITPFPDSILTLEIYNLYEAKSITKATVNRSYLVIEDQPFLGQTISGYGAIREDSSLFIDYSITFGDFSERCVLKGKRK